MIRRILIWSTVIPLFLLTRPALSQYVWMPPAVIDTSAPNLDRQLYVCMAVDDSGNIGVAWGESRSQPGSGYIVFEWSSNQGSTWRRTEVSTLGYGRVARDIEFDHEGTIWLLWSGAAGEFEPSFLNLSKSTDTGLTFTTVFSSQEHGGIMFFSCLAVDLENSIYMLWDDQEFKLTRFRSGDIAQRIDIDIPNDTLSVGNLPSLVVSKDHIIYCLWEGFYSNSGLFQFVFCSVSNDTGQSFSFTSRIDTVDIPLPWGGAAHLEPSGDVDSSGTLHVAYRKVLQTVNNWDVRVVKSTDRGQSFSVPIVLDDVGTNNEPQICTDVGGGVNVAWSANDGLRFRRSTDGGETFSQSQLIGAGWKRIAGDGRGNLYVAYDNLRAYFTRTNVLVSVLPISDTPGMFGISRNYPNPFNSSTHVQFSIVKRASVSLKVYDILGREVVVLVDQEIEGGVYERTWNATGIASGFYFLRMEVNGSPIATHKMILL